MRLPQVTGTLSSSTKLKFSTIDSSIVEMLYQPSITEDFANLSAWTETDADNKVNLSGGIITMDGGNSWSTHGLLYTAGVSRANAFHEIKFSIASSIINNFIISVRNSNALPNPITATDHVSAFIYNLVINPFNASMCIFGSTYTNGVATIAAATYYTLRLYTELSIDGTSWRKFRITIEGGVFTAETEVYSQNKITTEFGSTLYFCFQRYASSSANLVSFKEYRYYTGYATDGPYTEYIHDAGASNKFYNFDLTTLTLPGTVPSTNLKFDYCFSDTSTAFQGSYITLAQLNAVGKLVGKYRYIGIRVQSNSDGATQILSAKPNSDTATDAVINPALIMYPSAA